MAAISSCFTLADVYDYLPNFDAECDAQVGDWVAIQPRRMTTLLGPLIATWEKDVTCSGNATATTLPQYGLREMLPESLTLRRRSLSCGNLAHFAHPGSTHQLAPLSVARAYYNRRKRAHMSDANEEGPLEDETLHSDAPSSNGVLYLHVRLGLLTASRPYIFGGLDIVEVLMRPSEEEAAECASNSSPPRTPVVMYLNLLTGETRTREEAVRRVMSTSGMGAFPEISGTSTLETVAENEWRLWADGERESNGSQLCI